MKTVALTLLAGIALMACTPSTAPEVTDGTPVARAPLEPASAPPSSLPADTVNPPEDACNAAQYAPMVGEPAGLVGIPPASPSVRHIRPDTEVTMDFRADRLNIDINADDMITGFRCG
ncbi:MAG: I78 family peptidase inhibitor [Alphaproteobacteria bacterium]|nr:I78 family peptidase inhibitor [Alphaproteobacteria bacterium]